MVTELFSSLDLKIRSYFTLPAFRNKMVKVAPCVMRLRLSRSKFIYTCNFKLALMLALLIGSIY